MDLLHAFYVELLPNETQHFCFQVLDIINGVKLGFTTSLDMCAPRQTQEYLTPFICLLRFVQPNLRHFPPR